jgi:spore germination protein YaaH
MITRKKKIGIAFLLIGLFLLSVLSFLFIRQDAPLLSPVTGTTTFEFLNSNEKENKQKRIVYGFLPYWNLNKAKLQPELTNLAYFSLTIGKTGNIVTQTADGTDPGYSRWSSDDVLNFIATQEKNKGKVEIVLSQFNNDDIAAFLTNSTAHNNLIKSLDSVLLAYPVDGINIDIEYTGEITPGIRNGLTSFMEQLNTHLAKKFPTVKLSIDVLASAATVPQIWDIDQIKNSVDYIIIMAYDFHRRSSIVAGPVAPLFGGRKLWNSDITQYLKDFLERVPKQKIVLGLPFYGYEWQTTSRDSQAQTYPDTGATASIGRVEELLKQKEALDVQENWNDDALSPYLSYKKNKDTYVIYYENSRSLSYKMDLVNQLDLGGVAIWALGYEGSSRELWDVIKRKN